MINPTVRCRLHRVLPALSFTLTVLFAAAMGPFSVVPAQAQQDQEPRSSSQSWGLRSVRPVRIRSVPPKGGITPQAQPQCSDPQVGYFGGPVVSNTQIV